MDIWGFYTAVDRRRCRPSACALTEKFARLEQRLGDGPYFDGARFSLVDAAFGPAFRYFDAFDRIGDFGILADKPKVDAWRQALGAASIGRPRGAARISRAPVGVL